MQGHRRRQATKRCTAIPVRPKGYGGTGSSAVWALLDNVQTLPASRRLVSDPAAPVTRPQLLFGQAPKPGLCIASCHVATESADLGAVRTARRVISSLQERSYE